MALEWNLYLAPLVEVTGLPGFPPGARVLNSKIKQIVTLEAGESVAQVYVYGRRIGLARVKADPAKHLLIQADPEIIRIFPVTSATPGQIVANLDAPLVDLYPPAARSIFRGRLEAIGFDTDWFTAGTTMRDLVRRMLRHVRASHLAKSAAARDLYSLGLSVQVGNIPADRRNAIKSWMESRGLATAWITATTTVREVLRYVVENLTLAESSYLGGVK